METPSFIVDDVYRLVENAIRYGVSVADFKRVAAQAWDDALREKREGDAREFDK